MNEIQIRPETANAVDSIREVNIEAFRNHPVSRQTEHLIVDALRSAGSLDISLVAVRDERVVGHIAFSAAGVGESETGWFILGPVAVLPDVQGEGIGTALVEAGLSELRTRNASGCVLVGDPGFYGRFGFTAFPELVYEGVPQKYVLALPFGDAVPSGGIHAHAAFEVEPESDPRRSFQAIQPDA